MEALTGVMDAPETEVADPIEPVEGQETTETAEPTQETTQAEEVAGDGRKLPQWIRDLKAANPEGYKSAKDTWFERAAWKEKFQGGTKEADDILGFLSDHGGRDGLTQALGDLTAKATELDAIQERIANADPSLITELPPESVAKLGPALLSEWSKANYDSYNAQLSGVFAQTISQAGIPLEMERITLGMDLLRDTIENTPELKANPFLIRAFNSIFSPFDKVKNWSGSFANVPAQPAQAKPNPEIDAREQNIRQKESAMAFADFDRQIESFKAPFIETEMKSWFDKAPGDSEKRDAAVSMLRQRISEALTKEEREKGAASTASQVKALYSKGDVSGALRITKSRETALIRELAPKVGRIIYGSAEAPKPVVKPEVRTVRTPPPTRPRDPFDAIFSRA